MADNGLSHIQGNACKDASDLVYEFVVAGDAVVPDCNGCRI